MDVPIDQIYRAIGRVCLESELRLIEGDRLRAELQQSIQHIEKLVEELNSIRRRTGLKVIDTHQPPSEENGADQGHPS